MCVVACLVFFVTSCVQEEYKISEETLNLEVTVFQDGVSIPLGSTKAIKVSELVDQLDPKVKEMFDAADGIYAFGMADKFDFSDQLSFLSDNFSIEAFNNQQVVAFNLADVDVSAVTVQKQEISFEQNLSDVVSPVELTIQPIQIEQFKETTDISSYVPKDDDMNISVPGYSYDGVIATLRPVSGLVNYKNLLNEFWNDEYPIDQIKSLISNVPGASNLSMDTKTTFEVNEPINIPIEVNLPEAITDVNSIEFAKDAQVEISLNISDDLFFTSGKIIPTLSLDLTEIFGFDIEQEFVLSSDTPDKYSASRSFDVEKIVLNDGDIRHSDDNHLVLSKNISVTPALKVATKDLKTSLAKLSSYTQNTDIEMSVTVAFKNFVIGNVAVDVEPIRIEVATELDLSISQELPEMVNGVKSVTFDEDSGLSLKLGLSNVDRIENLDFAVKSFVLTFPEGLEVANAENNVLTLPIGSLSDQGWEDKIVISKLNTDPSKQTHGNVSFDGKVKVSADIEIGVKDGEFINTKDLPRKNEDNISLSVDAVAELEVADFEVEFNGYYYDVEQETNFEFNVPQEVAELGAVKIVPANEPVITIDLELPDTDLEFAPSEEGLVIDFPDMITFKPLADGLVLEAGNVLKFTDALPSEILLPIDYIIAEGEKVEGKDGYWVSDMFKVKGSVGVAPGIVTKSDIDGLTAEDAKVSFNALIPELVPATVDINSYQASVPEEEIGFGENIDLSTLPPELVGVGEILLKDVVLDVDIKAPGINELIKDADVNLSMYVTLPEAIMVKDGIVNEEGVLEIKGKLVNEEIVVDPIDILGLRLNKTAEELSEYLSGLKITYGGNISVENATIDMDALEAKDLNLNVDIKLASVGSDKIEIGRVTGYVDYKVDPINSEVELGTLIETLNSDGLKTTLDLNRFSLALDLKTNLSIPLLADLSIIPYKNGAVIEDKVLSKTLDIKMPEATGEPSLIRYWISNYPQDNDQYMPSGYEHISLDLISLIPLNPDKIVLTLNAGTDPNTLASIVPSENGYVLEAEYAFNLPFEFGEDAKIEFRQVIGDIPAEVGTVLQYGSLGLAGVIENSLPLGLELSLNFLDSEGNVIDLAENAGKQTVKPGTVAGDAVKTDLNLIIAIKKGVDVSDLSAIELVFNATSVPGAPLKKDSYIKATLQALVPEGVTMDLSQFMTENEE